MYRLDDHRFLLVVNASNREADFEWLRERELRGSDVRDVSDDYGLLAVQGPRALERLGLAEEKAFTWQMGRIDGVEVMVNHTGYTGERGVELACMAEDAPALWDAVVGRGVRPCGLGARDTLRLEAGYPLYGNDIDDTVTPLEAGLAWIVKLDKGADFTGLAALKRQKLEGVKRRLVGFKMTEPRVVARHGYGVFLDGTCVDVVRSGTVTPTANWAIGMTYLPVEHAKPAARFEVDVRGKRAAAEVVRLPFVERKTKK